MIEPTKTKRIRERLDTDMRYCKRGKGKRKRKRKGNNLIKMIDDDQLVPVVWC